MKERFRRWLLAGPIGRIVASQLSRPKGLLAGWIGKVMNRSNDALYAAVSSKLPNIESQIIVEYGFGNGKFIPEILWERSGAKYVGVEASIEMLELAEQECVDLIRSGRVELFLSGESLPVRPGSADAVLLINVIYFWEDPVAELMRIFQLLNRQGRLIVGIRPEEALRSLIFIQTHFSIRTEEDWLSIFRQAGFELVQTERITRQTEDDLDGLTWVFQSAS